MRTAAHTETSEITNQLVEIIPEFNLIEDNDLRDKAILVWHDAIILGKWNLKDLTSIPFSRHVENCQITFIEHVRTVCKMCLKIGETLKESYGERFEYSRDYLIAGALLADVGKLLEYMIEDSKIIVSKTGQFLRHPFIGVSLSSLRGIPVEVQHIIATHSKEGDIMIRSNESVIFHHADFIDFDLASKKRPF